MVRLLLDQYAPLTIKKKAGLTPLQCALKRQDKAMANILRKLMADR